MAFLEGGTVRETCEGNNGGGGARVEGAEEGFGGGARRRVECEELERVGAEESKFCSHFFEICRDYLG